MYGEFSFVGNFSLLGLCLNLGHNERSKTYARFWRGNGRLSPKRSVSETPQRRFMKQGNVQQKSMPKNRLWLYRKKMGYSQKVVAQLLGRKSSARICDYERGKFLPSLETALKLEIILGIPLRELYSNIYRQLQREINHKRRKLSENAQNK